MTVLATRTQRDSLGINCIERGIVYALLLLRHAVKNQPDSGESQNLYKDSAKISYSIRRQGDSQVAFLDSEVRLPYGTLNSLKNAWAVARNLLPITQDDPNPFAQSSSPYNNPLAPHAPIPSDPVWVDTLEKYFGWLACLLAANTFPLLDYCQIQNLEDAPAYPTFFVKLFLPFRYQNYLLSGNLLESLIAVVSDLNAEPDIDPIDLSIPSLVSAKQILFKGTGENKITITPNFTANSLIATYPNGDSRELGGVNSDGISGTAIVALLEGLTGAARLNASAVRDIPSLTASQIVALLAGLTGDNRLDAAAIKNLPDGGATLTGADIVALLAALTGDNRLDATAIKNLPSGGSSLTGADIVALLAALTGDNRLDATAIKNLPSGGSSLTGADIADLLEGLTGDNRLDATAIKNLPSGGGGNTLYNGLTYHFPFNKIGYSVASPAAFFTTMDASYFSTTAKFGKYSLQYVGSPFNIFSSSWRLGDFDQDFTLSFWHYPTSSANSFDGIYLFEAYLTNATDYPYLQLFSNGRQQSGQTSNFYKAVTNYVAFGSNGDRSNGDTGNSLSVALNQWHLVILRYNASSRILTLSVDNNHYNSGTMGTFSEESAAGRTSTLMSVFNNGQGLGATNHNDRIDQLIWWHRRLSDDECTNLYNSGNGVNL